MRAGAELSESVVSPHGGYNSWPMIQAVGGKLVCAYSRGLAHTIGDGERGVYVRVSSDGGLTWGGEKLLVNDPAEGEVTIGKGLDSKGAMLLWVRCCGKKWHHDLYRTVDGETFEKISSPALSPMPMQITDVFSVPGVGLMSLWFAGNYKPGPHGSWGVLTSKDDGATWTQRTVEKDQEKTEWPTEPSAVYLGNGRILVVARSEVGGSGCQFQIVSTDSGATWRRTKTNITDVFASTPSLLLDSATGLVSNYYYQRGARKLKCRVARADDVFENPLGWPDPKTLAEGREEQVWDAGNVNATSLGGRHFAAYYTGTPSDTDVKVIATAIPVGQK